MAVTQPPTTKQVLAISGESIIVFMRPVVGQDNEVSYHITRNGATESRFSLDELTEVLMKSQQLLVQARSRVRVPTPAHK